MKWKSLFFVLLALAAALPGNYARCETNVVEFSHPNGNKAVESFLVYDRIVFEEDCMYLVSSSDSDVEPITLPYDGYQRIKFSSDDAGTENPAVASSRLVYDRRAGCVKVNGEDGADFAVAVYSYAGMVMANGYGSVAVGPMAAGAYIAVATDGKVVYKLKYVK